MREGPGHYGWHHPWAGGPGYLRKAAECEPRTSQDATSLHSSCLDFPCTGIRMSKPDNLFLLCLLWSWCLSQQQKTRQDKEEDCPCGQEHTAAGNPLERGSKKKQCAPAHLLFLFPKPVAVAAIRLQVHLLPTQTQSQWHPRSSKPSVLDWDC